MDFTLLSGVEIIKNETNQGFLTSINKGIVKAKGDFIYILNNDTEVKPKFLSELFYVFEYYENGMSSLVGKISYDTND